MMPPFTRKEIIPTILKNVNFITYNWATLFLGEYKYMNPSLHVVGVSKIETIKYAYEARRTQS
jgi:hypothetical protein